jgi:hypothetical protein
LQREKVRYGTFCIIILAKVASHPATKARYVDKTSVADPGWEKIQIRDTTPDKTRFLYVAPNAISMGHIGMLQTKELLSPNTKA